MNHPTERRSASTRARSCCCWLGAVWIAAAALAMEARAQSQRRPELMTKLEPCRIAGVADSVLCGRFEVPEDRAKPAGRKISLNVVVLPATGDSIATAADLRMYTTAIAMDDLGAVLNRLRDAPANVLLDGPGGAREVQVSERAVRDLVQGMLGSARAIERLPALLHAGGSGDLRPLASALGEAGGPPPPPRGVFLCILCSEAMPQVDPRAIPVATRGTFFGDFPVRWQLRQCSAWPRGPLPKGFWQPVSASVPVLAISGDLDPITPPRYAESVARELKHGTHIVVPNRSHNDVDPCITSMFENFLIAGSSAGLDTSCVALPHPLHFATGPSTPPGR